MCNNFVVVFGMYIKRFFTEGEGSRGEGEHEERGADAREAVGGVDGVAAAGRGRR